MCSCRPVAAFITLSVSMHRGDAAPNCSSILLEIPPPKYRHLSGNAVTYNSTSQSTKEICNQNLATNTPFAYLIREKTDPLCGMDDGMIGILYCSQVEKKKGKALRSTHFKLMEFKNNIGPEKPFDDTVGAFFATLHDLILTKPDRCTIPTLSPKAFFDLSIEKYCPLLAALYKIATGGRFKKQQDCINWVPRLPVSVSCLLYCS